MGAFATTTAKAERMVPMFPARTTGSLSRMEVTVKRTYLLSRKCPVDELRTALGYPFLASIPGSIIVMYAVMCSNV